MLPASEVPEPSSRRRDAAARLALARERQAFARERYWRAKQLRCDSKQLMRQVARTLRGHFGPIPTTEAVVGRMVATYLTLSSCLASADSETAERLRAAMASLDDLAYYAETFPAVERYLLAAAVDEIDHMAQAVRQHLRDGAGTEDG